MSNRLLQNPLNTHKMAIDMNVFNTERDWYNLNVSGRLLKFKVVKGVGVGVMGERSSWTILCIEK